MHVIAAHDVAAALRALHERIVDLHDPRHPPRRGRAASSSSAEPGRWLAPPAIFISGHATLTEAAQAVKLGGFDFLEKPFSAEKLAVTVQRCLEMSTLQERLRLRGSAAQAAPQIVGDSAAIRQSDRRRA